MTLTSLCVQVYRDFRVIISARTDEMNVFKTKELQAVLRILEAHDNSVKTYKNLPRRGIAEQRQFLLKKATAPYILFLDDDVILEPYKYGGCGLLPSGTYHQELPTTISDRSVDAPHLLPIC